MTQEFTGASDPTPMPQAASDPLYQKFFDGLKQKTLWTRRCAQCGTWQWPPQTFCFHCQSTDFEWHELPTSGEVYSYSVMYRAFDRYHADKLPYGVVIVKLGEIHITGRFLGDPEDIHCGLPVEAAWDELAVAGSSPAFQAVS